MWASAFWRLELCGDHGGVTTMSGPMWMPDQPPTLGRIFALHWQPIPLLPVIVLALLVAYLGAVRVLARRGVRWPWWKTAAWLAGLAVIWETTATGIEGYGMMLFSVHMAQHMALAMVAPILLVVGSPVTLALRVLPAQGRGAWVRRALVRLLGSWFFRILASTPSRWFLFLSGLYGIYFTPLFGILMASVWGHYFMLLHFIITGYLFFGPLLGTDPWPGQTKTPLMRLLETFVGTPFHAFFGISLMMATEPVVSFFTDPPLWWHVDLAADQNLAGGIAWATSELPTILVMGAILIQWVVIDRREADRYDRRAERDDDAELAAYNARLAALAEHAERTADAVPTVRGTGGPA